MHAIKNNIKYLKKPNAYKIYKDESRGAYNGDVDCKLGPNSYREDHDNGRNGTHLNFKEAHNAWQLHHFHAQDHNLETVIITNWKNINTGKNKFKTIFKTYKNYQILENLI